MNPPRSPHREIVDIENNYILASVSTEMWATFQECARIADFYDLPKIITDMESQGIRLSSAVGGEHRRDLVMAIQGQKPPTLALGVPLQENGATNGHAKEVVRPRL